MSTFTVSTTIQAPRTQVWSILADIGAIAKWNPRVVESHLSSDAAYGVGATRYVAMDNKFYIDEEVIEWDEEARLTVRIIDTNLPFKGAEIQYALQGDDKSTSVTVTPKYKMPYGLLGKLIDAIYMHRTYKKSMGLALGGLKSHAEPHNGR